MVQENELTCKKADNPIMQEAEKNLGETKKKKRRSQKKPEECFMETPKVDRNSFAYIQQSPCFEFDNNKYINLGQD